MNIYINIPQRQYRNLKSEIDTAVQNVLESDRWLLGTATETFAKQFSDYVGVDYCLPVANGTDALEIALRSIGAEPGSGCITVANAGGYTSTACSLVGLQPQYIDVYAETLTLNIDLLVEAIQERTKVIVLTHLYGNVVDVVRVRKVLEDMGRTDISIVEDCAQAHGAYCNGKRVGSLGDIATFSFYPTKNLGALGDGGAIVTNNEHLYRKVKQLHQYGWSTRYHNDIPCGRNSRMDEIQAAILSVKLPYLDEWNKKRRGIVEAYATSLPEGWNIRTEYSSQSVCHLAIIEAPTGEARTQLLENLKEKGIYGDIHYPILDCDQPAWKESSQNLTSLTNSYRAIETICTLPCFPEMTEEEIQVISKLLSTTTSTL